MAKRVKKSKKKASKKGAKRKARRAGRTSARQLAIGDLEAMLAEKKKQLDDLQKRRDKLAGELDAVDAEIAAISGRSRPGPKPGRKSVGAKGKGKSTGKRGGPRAGATLGNKLTEILAAAAAPTKLADIVDAVEKSDYPSKSKHLRSMISQTLSRDPRFRKVRRGTYKLA